MGLSLIIVGDESGPGARPCDVGWIRSIVAQCNAANVPCFVKQVGSDPVENGERWRLRPRLADRKGGDIMEWPEDIRVREMPETR